MNIVDLDCSSARETLLNVQPFLLGHPLRWLLLADTFSLDDHMQLLEKLPLRLDSNVILAEFTNSSTISLKHIYKINPSLPINHEDYGGWDLKTGITDVRLTRVLSRKRSNLHHTHLTASIVITNPDTVNHFEDYKDKHIDTLSKVNYKQIHVLMDTLNATKKFILQSSWGYLNKTTGKWSGMVGDLVNGTAEIGGTSLFITPERLQVIDYISQTVSTHGAFMFRSPPLSYVTNIFYLPFQGYVWISCLTLFFLCTLILFLTWQGNLKNKDNAQEREQFRLSDAVMTAVGAVTQQGSNMESNLTSGRISFFFLLLSMFFFYTAYTANIVALLQSTTTSISTLKDLLDSNLELGVEDIVYNRYYFPRTNEPIRKAIYETKIAPPGKKERYLEQSEGIAKVRQGLFAFYIEGTRGYKLIEETFYESEKCGLMEIEYLQSTDTWLSIEKYSAYKEVMKVSLFKMKESGVERRESSKLYMKKPICAAKGQNFDSVRLIDCYITIMIILLGYILSLVVFGLEHLIKRQPFNLSERLCLS
ncbi:probable glutamate receptor [Phlebotomus papatasi]|uniref:probable glutamate receptor n=1 Tax=Phlebotomus papatasi TaxID=29031 RepID=UPI002483D976|nr:probable glutamate receptor [Phlebotomus papatasi]